MQLQYVQLITDKTIAADLPGGVFTILISVTQMNKNTKFNTDLQILAKSGRQWCNNGSNELYFQYIKNPQNSGHFPINWSSKYKKNEVLKTLKTYIYLIRDDDKFKH